MRRAAPLTAILMMAALSLPAHAQTTLPPHAWLFGAWTGGFFPPPSSITTQQCLAQPVVIFTRDVVMRAVITDVPYVERQVETARVTPEGVEFRFTPPVAQASANPFSPAPVADDQGFGCISPDVLRVQRRSANEISFPGCSDFPYPLIRCP
jgi:hypothetical protein